MTFICDQTAWFTSEVKEGEVLCTLHLRSGEVKLCTQILVHPAHICSHLETQTELQVTFLKAGVWCAGLTVMSLVQLPGWSGAVRVRLWLIWTAWCNCGGWGMRFGEACGLHSSLNTSFLPLSRVLASLFSPTRLNTAVVTSKRTGRKATVRSHKALLAKLGFFCSFHWDTASDSNTTLSAHARNLATND